MYHIVDNLYQGNLEDFLQSKHDSDWWTINLMGEQKILESNHFFELYDMVLRPEEFTTFQMAIKCVEESTAKKKILVFCRMGVNRSSSVILSALTIDYRFQLRDAMVFLKKQNPMAKPFINYVRWLAYKTDNDIKQAEQWAKTVFGEHEVGDNFMNTANESWHQFINNPEKYEV